jgi:hypothetical protein
MQCITDTALHRCTSARASAAASRLDAALAIAIACELPAERGLALGRHFAVWQFTSANFDRQLGQPANVMPLAA